MGNMILGYNNTTFKVGGNDCSIYLGTTLVYSPTPVFEGKYRLTLSDSSTVSAECDSTSAVTSEEVSSQYSGTVVSAEIGSCVTTIGERAFQYCSGLTSIDIPNSVTNIGQKAFYNCTGLTSITIPDSVTSIGSTAFTYCSSLTSVTIPDSVTSIYNYTFQFCTSLTSVDIPDSVTRIGNYAFNGCSSLTSCTIGSGVTSIGNQAFTDTVDKVVTVFPSTPPTIASNYLRPFNRNYVTIYVPSELVDTYKADANWSYYASQIRPIQ